MSSEGINCPQCGGNLPLTFRFAKQVLCQYCGATLFLDDQAVKYAGKQAVLTEIPSLLRLGFPFRYRKKQFTPVGKIRYRHSIGFWEEWWAVDQTGKGFWLSVDEGDFAFENSVLLNETVPRFEAIYIGQKLRLLDQNWQVTEKNVGECEGFQGELPEQIKIGEKIPYVHLSAPRAKLLTLEYDENKVNAYLGEWIDPFDIKADV